MASRRCCPPTYSLRRCLLLVPARPPARLVQGAAPAHPEHVQRQSGRGHLRAQPPQDASTTAKEASVKTVGARAFASTSASGAGAGTAAGSASASTIAARAPARSAEARASALTSARRTGVKTVAARASASTSASVARVKNAAAQASALTIASGAAAGSAGVRSFASTSAEGAGVRTAAAPASASMVAKEAHARSARSSCTQALLSGTTKTRSPASCKEGLLSRTTTTRCLPDWRSFRLLLCCQAGGNCSLEETRKTGRQRTSRRYLLCQETHKSLSRGRQR
jgi:hypothetical protein